MPRRRALDLARGCIAAARSKLPTAAVISTTTPAKPSRTACSASTAITAKFSSTPAPTPSHTASSVPGATPSPTASSARGATPSPTATSAGGSTPSPTASTTTPSPRASSTPSRTYCSSATAITVRFSSTPAPTPFPTASSARVPTPPPTVTAAGPSPRASSTPAETRFSATAAKSAWTLLTPTAKASVTPDVKPSAAPSAKPRWNSNSEWLLMTRFSPVPAATVPRSSLPRVGGLTALLSRPYSSHAGNIAPAAMDGGEEGAPEVGEESARMTDEDDASPPTDSRPPLPQVELPPFNDRVIYHRMPEYLSVQQQWDPLVYASLNNPCMKVRLFGSQSEIEILMEMWQEAFNSLLHLIENMARSGYSSYHKINLSLLVMINNRFELRDGVPLIKVSKESYNRDMRGGAEVIEGILNYIHGPGALDKIPDLKALVRKMKDKSAEKGYLLLVDPSLMPLHFRGPATVDVYNFLKFESSEEFFAAVVTGLTYTDNADWIPIARANKLLETWLEGGMNDPEDHKKPEDFVGYLRVCYSHIMDHRSFLDGKFFKMTNKVNNKKYSKRHANLVIYGNYRMTLSDLYNRLWQKRRLRNLNPEPHMYIRYRV